MKNYNDVLIKLLKEGNRVDDTTELINQCLELPVDKLFTSKIRLISPYYLVGELMFCLANSNSLEFISHYSKFWKNISDDGETVRSAYFWQARYGHGFDQVRDVVDKLKRNKNSRQAIIHLHHAHNSVTKDEICTLTLQFMIRNDELIMIVNMRSNDIILGLPYDHAMFLLLGNMIAEQLGIKLRKYYHNVGSLHKYDRHKINLNKKDEPCEYSIEFQSEFFKNIPGLVYLEKMIRQEKLELQALIAIVECFEDSLSRTFGMILLMHNKDMETKKMIFNQLSNVCQQGLTQLLSDYENFGG